MQVTRNRLIARGDFNFPFHLTRHYRNLSSFHSVCCRATMTTSYIDKDLTIQGATTGKLSGRFFAVKDLFDVSGQKTGFGNPVWQETHEAALSTAPAIQALLNAGATLRGKTHMDELAYSLNGENYHYGTPANPRAPGRIPGGSSSGSASVVAAGDVDFALGSDTGGSVRIPASYCGLYGFRPTHGRISLDNARPLAPSFDTVGFFTRDAILLKEVALVLLASKPSGCSNLLRRWLIAEDAFALTEKSSKEALKAILARQIQGIPGAVESSKVIDLASGLSPQGLGKLTDWFDVFRICQGWEVWHEHGHWVSQHEPRFGPGIKERFEMASGITQEAKDACDRQRGIIRDHMNAILKHDGVLVIPTAPGPAPLLATPANQLDIWRKSMISLTCIAGLAGLPQVNLPSMTEDKGLPIGLSLVGPHGSDEELLELAVLMSS